MSTEERQMVQRWKETAEQLAKDVLSLARDAGMPDSFLASDSRAVRAKMVLEDSNPISSEAGVNED